MVRKHSEYVRKNVVMSEMMLSNNVTTVLCKKIEKITRHTQGGREVENTNDLLEVMTAAAVE